MHESTYDHALHTLWLDNGRWLTFSKLIDDKHMAEMRTSRMFELIDGSLKDTLTMFKSAWAIAGISNWKHLIRWIPGFQPTIETDRFTATLYMKRDKQVEYSPTDGSYVTTFYVRCDTELDMDDQDELLSWLHNGFGLAYPYTPSPGGTGRTLHGRQQGKHILIETRTYRDV